MGGCLIIGRVLSRAEHISSRSSSKGVRWLLGSVKRRYLLRRLLMVVAIVLLPQRGTRQ
jgi:hypothetical protein